MTYLRGFIPWIAYGAVAWASWQWAALAALLLGGVLLYLDRAGGLSPSMRVLEYGTLVFFAASPRSRSSARTAGCGLTTEPCRRVGWR
ncbi:MULTISPECIES: hypothetical protein [Streptomyces]|uniref:Uncharacterized protein n=1 Tax=Streptomyces rimosus subsp. rimosus TaxID=132474 RepID=A0ABY3Z421_STRRM|nr:MULTISPECIES: hypothetical protein [Streptomyces]KEF08122.1 hypothetical protein DF17_07480 [Streptomyces rimosus]UNZ04305.1 hypothetical protein SRIMR7_19290 [Streptomyces rimosus subsp. rimosus]UTH95782.1 hypothetical protein SRIMHP_16770 [Streptomyces rimosus subsp. rimosus]UTJ13879.1 hypothetical protein SRIMDV3_16665 [Streptomyces rimosus subsp. rimosus]